MIVFRQADSRYPFLWSESSQPPARWHGEGEGPAHYFADTPDGAWAELLRHEEITDAADVATIRRALWAIEIGDEPLTRVTIAARVAVGGRESHRPCRAHARRLRARGARRIEAPSAALLPGGATGRVVSAAEERDGPHGDGRTIVVFGDPSRLVGWKAVDAAAPPASVLPRVRHE